MDTTVSEGYYRLAWPGCSISAHSSLRKKRSSNYKA